MKDNSRWWVVTDIDGTLMDHNYDLSPAIPTIKWLQENNIPVIPCTSKTASEVKLIRTQINLKDPYIVENGGAVYGLRDDSLEEWELVLGRRYDELLKILDLISEEIGYGLVPFNSLSDKDINVLTGLEGKSIILARERLWSVPFLNPPLEIQKSIQLLQDEFNVTILQGNRMSHLLSKGSHKGKAVTELKKFLGESNVKILALGDSPNDIPLLEVADIAVVVAGKNGANQEVLSRISHIEHVITDLPNAFGWASSVKNILAPII